MEQQSLSTLLKKLPTISDSRMVTNGFAVWVVWRDEPVQAVGQTLMDYGGMPLPQERRQSLWFFFNSDVFLALARLEVWARMNPIPVFVQVSPAKLLLGYKLEVSLSLDSALAAQHVVPGDEFQVFIHPKVQPTAKAIPGISLEKIHITGRLASQEWLVLRADPRLPYQSSSGWYLVLKPLGNPLDKSFQNGWRSFFEPLEEILKRMKLKYLIHDFFLMFPLENLRQLRLWCKEYLSLIRRIKEEQTDQYWPCVVAVVERKGLNFNKEMPKKVPLDWDQLMPDFPHMSYRTAFLMGEGFKINDVRFSVDQSNVDDWCNVSLSDEGAEDIGSMQIELPKRLVAGKHTHCFYCGLRSHPLQECPSRGLHELQLDIWESMAAINIQNLREGLESINVHLSDSPESGIIELFDDRTVGGLITRAIFAINMPAQHRMMRTVWRSMGKDYPGALHQLAQPSNDLVLTALNEMLEGEALQADRTLSQAALKGPRNYQPRTMQGVSAMEKGDLERALAYWKEAESLAQTPFQSAYHVYLQARAMEVQGKLQQASSQYKQVLNYTPLWLDAIYRQGVCLVKMGFAEQAMSFFENLISKDPNMFNRVLIDPELERGHLHLMTSLYGMWTAAESKAAEERAHLNELKNEVNRWFPEDHPFSEELLQRIGKLVAMGDVQNYVAYHALTNGRGGINKELQQRVEQESKRLKSRFESFMNRLKAIREEAAWFPFPRILVEFNKDFNFCAKNLNWAMRQHFSMADTFRKAADIAEKVEEKVKGLEHKLKTLKIVRDATLFVLIMGKSFFWLELGGLLISLLALPITIYYGQKMGYDWASGLVVKQKWEIQKGMIIILSITALALAALRTALVFEKRKERLFRSILNKE